MTRRVTADGSRTYTRGDERQVFRADERGIVPVPADVLHELLIEAGYVRGADE